MNQHLLQAARARAARTLPAFAAALLCACGGSTDSQNLGDTADAQSAPLEQSMISDFVGTWVGEAEDPLGPADEDGPAMYRFPSGSTQIRFEYPQPATPFDATSSLTFGGGVPQPWAIDVDASYPPGVDYAAGPGLWYASQLPPAEGYPYQLGAPDYNNSPFPPPLTLADGVLHLTFATNQAITPWCQAQTPVPTPAGVGCLDSGGTIGRTDLAPEACLGSDGTEVDCGKYRLCYGVLPPGSGPLCLCTESGCDIDTSLTSELFLRRDGDDIVGVLSDSVFLRAGGTLASVGEIRFHRE